MEFLQKMEEKIFEKFDFELSSKKETEIKVAQYLEEKFNIIKAELQKESKTRYENIENLEYYFEVKQFFNYQKELPKIQEGFKAEQQEREENDNNNIQKLSEECEKYLRFYYLFRIDNLVQNEKKNREETQEGILEMIKIMNDRLRNDLSIEKKERYYKT